MIWRPGDTKTHLVAHPLRFDEGVDRVENPTGIGWDDILDMLKRQESADTLTTFAVASAQIN
jgi:hypothetical protein